MPLPRFKRFSDLAFIQSINIEDQLVPFLREWEEELGDLGLDLNTLRSDDGDVSARRIIETLVKTDELPGRLQEVLYSLDDMADEQGHDRLIDLIDEEGVRDRIPGLDGHLSEGDLVILVQRTQPRLLQVCHDRTTHRKSRKFIEWQPAGDRTLTMARAKQKCGPLSENLAAWFGSKNRGQICEMTPYQEGDELRFMITHGKSVKSEGSFAKDLRRDRTSYRPQKHDMVIWDSARRVLMISASTQPEKDIYRRRFGEFMFGSADYFPSGNLYTLAPLQARNVVLATAPGVVRSRLVEVVMSMSNGRGTRQVTTGYDVLATARDGQAIPDLTRGTIVSAAFSLKYDSGGRERRLEIKPPNVAIFDRDRDGTAAMAWIRANDLLVEQAEDAEDEADDGDHEEAADARGRRPALARR